LQWLGLSFGGEMADEQHLSFVRKISARRADDNTVAVVFNKDVIVQIGTSSRSKRTPSVDAPAASRRSWP
jgi:hypothetical protein